MNRKTNLMRFIKIAACIALAVAGIAMLSYTAQGDQEYQELRAYEATHQPQVKHFYH